MKSGHLCLHAWWFNMKEGQLYAFNQDKAAFEPVLGIKLDPTVNATTALSAIRPERFIAAVAGKKPAF